MKKRIISIALTVALLITLIPMAAITAKAEGSIPVTITIKEAEEQKLVFDCTGNASGSFEGVAFEAAVAAEHNYILTVEWPEEKNGIEYAEGNRTLVLTISVKGEQID